MRWREDKTRASQRIDKETKRQIREPPKGPTKDSQQTLPRTPRETSKDSQENLSKNPQEELPRTLKRRKNRSSPLLEEIEGSVISQAYIESIISSR